MNILRGLWLFTAGVKEILDSFLADKPIRQEFLILDKGELASQSYTEGGTTKGAL